MSRNKFRDKMKNKSSKELENIISDEANFHKEAIEAAKNELAERKTNPIITETTDSDNANGEENYEDFLSNVKTKSSFRGTPKSELKFQTSFDSDDLDVLTLMVFEKLDYDIVYHDKNQLEAKRSSDNNSKQWSNKITVVIGNRRDLTVKSISLTDGMWDRGKNSKIVQLFEHVFHKETALLTDQELLELKKEQEKEENMDDYQIPDGLPQIKKVKTPNKVFPIGCAILGALIIGSLFGAITNKFYPLFLMEVLSGLALSYSIYFGVKLGNYTNHLRLRTLIISSTILIIFSNHFIQYLIITREIDSLKAVNFIQFMQMRLEQGFILKDLNLGTIGFLLLFVFQFIIIYYLAMHKLTVLVMNFQIKRVPHEVTDYAFYHFVKGKTESGVRAELANMGWKDKQLQDEVFEAISAHQLGNAYRRMD